MRRITSGFAVEVFERRNARSSRLAEFLSVYVQHLGPFHRTNTNELLDFLADPPADRTITYYGLTYDDEPCGFATFMYYPGGPLGIVDHLVVAPNRRGFGAFFSFCDLIAGDLERRRVAFDHVAVEVILDERGVAVTIKPTMLVRLLRMVGFRVAKTRYWAPDPTIVEDRHSNRAALLLISQPERDEIPTAEFLRMVELIYDQHYAAWYERTLLPERLQAYRHTAKKLLNQIRSEVASESHVVLNGMKNLDMTLSLDPDPPARPSALLNIALLIIPAVVGIAVAVAQELWVTISVSIVTVIGLAAFAVNRRLRRLLLRTFRQPE